MFFGVAVSSSQIVGFCNLGDRGQGMELLRIYLLPDFIGKGIGRNLLALGEKFAIARGHRTYFCCVHPDNELGKEFYRKSGFQHIPQRDLADEWYLEKRIIES